MNTSKIMVIFDLGWKFGCKQATAKNYNKILDPMCKIAKDNPLC